MEHGLRVEQRPTRLGDFDHATKDVTERRAAEYAHPSDNFDRIARIKEVCAACPDPLARHALEMIAVKMARIIHDPKHLDSWIDIAGYARTGVMVTGE